MAFYMMSEMLKLLDLDPDSGQTSGAWLNILLYQWTQFKLASHYFCSWLNLTEATGEHTKTYQSRNNKIKNK